MWRGCMKWWWFMLKFSDLEARDGSSLTGPMSWSMSEIQATVFLMPVGWRPPAKENHECHPELHQGKAGIKIYQRGYLCFNGCYFFLYIFHLNCICLEVELYVSTALGRDRVLGLYCGFLLGNCSPLPQRKWNTVGEEMECNRATHPAFSTSINI